MLHKWSSVQGKLCAIQPHLCDEQFPFQWQSAISMRGFGAGRSSVVCGTRAPLSSLQNTFCNGYNNSCCAILASPPNTSLDVDTYNVLFEASRRRWKVVALCHMFAEQVPSMFRNAVNLHPFWAVRSITHKRSKHS